MADARIETRRASDGIVLRSRHWQPTGVPRGHVFLLHGIQSHSEWYIDSATALSDAGFDVRAPDRRGSGLSDGPRGHVRHLDRLLNDVGHFLFDLRCYRQRVGPVIVIGISWGGKFALSLARRFPVNGLALITPGLFSRFEPTLFQKFRLSLAERMGIEHRRVPIPFSDASYFTANRTRQDYIANDPLCLREVTSSFLFANRKLDRERNNHASLPGSVALMLAGQDRIIDNERTRNYFELISPTDSPVYEFEYAEHTLEFESSQPEYIEKLVTWAVEVADGFVSISVDHQQ